MDKGRLPGEDELTRTLRNTRAVDLWLQNKSWRSIAHHLQAEGYGGDAFGAGDSGERMREHRLPHAGDIFNQQVAPCQQARQREPDLMLFPQYDAAHLRDHRVDLLEDVAWRRRICPILETATRVRHHVFLPWSAHTDEAITVANSQLVLSVATI